MIFLYNGRANFNQLFLFCGTHSVRKHADDLKNNLENIVIPMFCSAEISKIPDLRIIESLHKQSIHCYHTVFSGNGGSKSQIVETTVAVGVQIEFVRCMCYIQTTITKFIDD